MAAAAALTVTDRERLVREHMPLARNIARRMRAAPGTGDVLNGRADVEGDAYEGLVRAANQFDGSCPFTAYATVRIRGTIMDRRRAHGALGRTQVRQLVHAYQTETEFAAREHRFPTGRELAKQIGMPARELGELRALYVRSQPVQIDHPLGPGGELTPADVICDPHAEQEMRNAEETQALDAAVDRLAPRDQLVVRLAFRDGWTLRQIGDVLDVTESRVCQVLKAALRKLAAIAPNLAPSR